MLAPWASEEMKTADLPDKRLNERLAIVLSQLAGQPTASIPAACGGYAEMAAAYRLFENERLCFEDVLQPHIDATRRRVAEQPVVILRKTRRSWISRGRSSKSSGPVRWTAASDAARSCIHCTPSPRTAFPWARSPRAFGPDRTSRPCRLRNARRDAKSFPSNRRKAGAGSTCCGAARARLRSAGHAVHLRGRQRGRYL